MQWWKKDREPFLQGQRTKPYVKVVQRKTIKEKTRGQWELMSGKEE
jgi:hypothetical protein